MERRFKITVEGRQYNVTVEEQTDLNNVYNLEPSVVPPSHLIMPAYTPAAPSNNSAHPAAAAAPRVAAEAGDIVSPLNGVVDTVLVTEGQQVAAGACVLVVEVMKMKTPVTTQAAGKVKAVLVKPGDGVESGQVLVQMA
jgi:glutaconyl-CoA/methylmalonyl-CoA decarboxylase subunit gamma